MLDLFKVVVGLHRPHPHDKPACADVSYGKAHFDAFEMCVRSLEAEILKAHKAPTRSIPGMRTRFFL